MRTTNASHTMATARPSPIILTRGWLLVAKPPKTEVMISAAATTTRALCRNPVTTAARASSPWAYASRARETRKTS
jgi:hypothetical protein